MTQQELNELKADIAASDKATAKRKASRAAISATWPTLDRGYTYRKSPIIRAKDLATC